VNLARVRAVAAKEWREIVRDRIVLLLAFLLPVVVMLTLGYGLVQDVEHVPTVIVDHDRSPSSREYGRHFIESRYFDVLGEATDARVGERLLADGGARLVLVIPEGFHERLAAGRRAEVQLLIDGTFTRTARTVQVYVEAINARVNVERQARWLAGRLGVSGARIDVVLDPLHTEVRYLYNEEVRSVWGVAPTLMMFTLTLVVPLLVALNVVREKETGSIYNIYASTITRAEFLAGKLAPNLAISAINAVVLWLLAMGLFGVPFRGSVPAFLVVTVLYLLAASSAGLVISLMVRTLQAALAVGVIAGVILAVQFSGMITPVSSLTGVKWLVAKALPPSHYNAVALSAFLKGAGIETIWREAMVFIGHTAGALAVAWLLFRKRIRA
jgi:ABC-2 type transport system permease protein/ribosome-dependent ATPase